MAKAMFKPDVALDGLEFSACTRLIEAAHNNKELGSEDDLEKCKEALEALKANGPVAQEDVKALATLAKKYQELQKEEGNEEVVGQFPNVKDAELKRLVKKLEGLEKGQETKDPETGKKVHPAAMPAGDEHKEDKKGSTNAPREGNDVPKLKSEGEKTTQDKAAEKRAQPAHHKK